MLTRRWLLRTAAPILWLAGRATVQAAEATRALGVASVRVSANEIVTAQVDIAPGVVITVDGCELTIAGPFRAPLRKVFECVNGGWVRFRNGSVEAVRAEWWGAVANGKAPSLVAINQALGAGLPVHLVAGAYDISPGPVRVLSHGVLIGAGPFITQLVIAAGSEDAILIRGGGRIGATENAYYATVSDFSIIRKVPPPTPVSPDADFSGAAGVRVLFAQHVRIRRVTDQNSFLGFAYKDTIDVQFEDCVHLRNTGAAGDRGYGFFAEGRGGDSPVISPNASVYHSNCSVSAKTAADITAFEARGRFGDLYYSNPASTGCAVGQMIDGLGEEASRLKVDVDIVNPIHDQIGRQGIAIRNTSAFGLVNVRGGYIAAGKRSQEPVLVSLTSASGVTVSDGLQLVGWPSPTTIPAEVIDSSRCRLDLQVQDCSRPILVKGSRRCAFTGDVVQTQAVQTLALDVQGGGGHQIALGVGGEGRGRLTVGVALSAGSSGNEVDGVRIDRKTVATPVTIAGRPVGADAEIDFNRVIGLLPQA